MQMSVNSSRDLRPRGRTSFSGFTASEVEKMERLLKEKGEQSFDQVFCKKLAKHFSHSKGRAGKPIVKWTEVLKWLQSRHRYILSQDTADDPPEELHVAQDACPKNGENETFQAHECNNISNLSELEFEARSSKDDAWYDVDTFIAHRFLPSGEAEVQIRFIGFGKEEDEWVKVRTAVRERSIALEDSECDKVQTGEVVLCFQELKDIARYHEALVVDIQRRMHDIRGCRCRFTVRYDRDNTEESVSLKRLCFRPSILSNPGKAVI